MHLKRHVVSGRLFFIPLFMFLLIDLIGLPLQAEGPSGSADGLLTAAPTSRSQAPALTVPQAEPGGKSLTQRGPFAVQPSSRHLTDTCLNYITNSELTYLDSWMVLDENVYWYTDGYVSPPHCALMVDGNDAGLSPDGSSTIDSFGQAFVFPDQAVSSLEVWFWAAFLDHDDWDDLYCSLFTVDAEGYLDSEMIRWGPVIDAGDNAWHEQYDTEDSLAVLNPLRGRTIALVFWSDTDGLGPL